MNDIPFVNASKFLIVAGLLILQLAVVPTSQAVVVSGLYDVEFPVPDQSRKVRNAVFSKGLEEVLIRVSGNRSILKQVKPAAASAYVQQYSYVEQQPDGADTSRSSALSMPSAAVSYVLKVQYSSGKIIALLRENGQPVWGGRRGESVVWLAVRDGKNRYVLTDSDTSLLKDALTQAAQRRGLPVIWPINDLKDQQQLRFTDLWAAFAQPIEAASKRYSKGPVIAGRLSWSGSNWRGDWSLFVDGSTYSWTLNGSDYNTVIAEGVDLSADKIGKHYAVLERTDNDGPDLLVEITNIDSLQNYRKMQQFLQGLAAVRQTDLVRLDQEAVVFRIDLRGDIDDFVRLVAIDRKLEPRAELPLPDAGVPGQQQTVLRYSYRQ
jgi:hypothetical protein